MDTVKEDAMKTIEKKVQETLQEGTVLSQTMEPLARKMLRELCVKPPCDPAQRPVAAEPRP
jgi:hypothetical protein